MHHVANCIHRCFMFYNALLQLLICIQYATNKNKKCSWYSQTYQQHTVKHRPEKARIVDHTSATPSTEMLTLLELAAARSPSNRRTANLLEQIHRIICNDWGLAMGIGMPLWWKLDLLQ
jgi:hypothetical protein